MQRAPLVHGGGWLSLLLLNKEVAHAGPGPRLDPRRPAGQVPCFCRPHLPRGMPPQPLSMVLSMVLSMLAVALLSPGAPRG